MNNIANRFINNEVEIGEYGSKFCVVFFIDNDQKCIFSNSKSDLKKLFKELAKITSEIDINPPEYWASKDEEYRDCGSHHTNSMMHFAEWFENFNYQLRNL